MRALNANDARVARHPFAVGFERLFADIDSLANATATGFPPYDMEMTSEDQIVVSLAVAGFSAEQLDVTVEGRFLTLSGRAAETDASSTATVLHRGIARRAFERRFVLAEHWTPGSVSLENGILRVEINRMVPESAKPRSIAIGHRSAPQAVVE